MFYSKFEMIANKCNINLGEVILSKAPHKR